MEVIGTPAQPA